MGTAQAAGTTARYTRRLTAEFARPTHGLHGFRRAATVGFDWPDITGPIAKIREELVEVEQELDSSSTPNDRLTAEIGDLLFAVVNLARKAGVQPSIALGQANRTYRARFEAVERLAGERE